MQFLAFPIVSGKLEAFRLFLMARYRIVSRPSRFDLKQSLYDVEERLSMEVGFGSTAEYWSYVDDFHSIEDAQKYVEALRENRLVVAEID